MIKFIKKEFEEAKVKHVVEENSLTWFEVVGEFQQFLEKCGYVFATGFDMSSILYDAHCALWKKKFQKKGKDQ
jgi:hypothetical protein